MGISVEIIIPKHFDSFYGMIVSDEFEEYLNIIENVSFKNCDFIFQCGYFENNILKFPEEETSWYYTINFITYWNRKIRIEKIQKIEKLLLFE